MKTWKRRDVKRKTKNEKCEDVEKGNEKRRNVETWRREKKNKKNVEKAEGKE